MGQQREWWTVQQAASALRVNPETVRRWIRDGDLPAKDLGAKKLGYRIARADLEAFVQLRFGETLGEESAAA